MDSKTDDVITFTDNGMGLKWATLYDEHAKRVMSTHRKFDARVDNTDHSAFFCEKCDREVRIVVLNFYKESSSKHKLELVYTLWFELFCEGCGASDTKKMYLNSPILGPINWN